MSVLQEVYTLYNGVKIPKIGFGTWQLPQEKAEQTVITAIKTGYRHIDTALGYGNEKGVGAGVRNSGVAREEIFVTTKIPAEVKSYAAAKEAIAQSLENLNIGYIDLLLIHAPRPWDEMHAGGKKPYADENFAVWTAMEEAFNAGMVRAIGVSNFEIFDMENIVSRCKIQPMVNQYRMFLGNFQAEIVNYCRAHNMLAEAYSPIATGRLARNEKVIKIAEKYGASGAQLSIRYLLQKGVLPLPKTTHEEYMRQNAAVEFTLSDADMGILDSLKTVSCSFDESPEITPVLKEKMHRIGVDEYEQLNEPGARGVFTSLKAAGEEVTYEELLALDATAKGIRVSELTETEIAKLKAFFEEGK
ncbi:MAG: aldo/keto reductase [Clostridia bacterium]|nr:aldo/keto reductase [Clostridia bacterium]